MESQSTTNQPSSARRFAKVCDILERHHHDSRQLIPILHDVQQEYRYLPEEVMSYLATALGVSPAHIYGVATFYAHFTLKARGENVVRFCDGTACHVKNSSGLIEAVRAHLKLRAGENTTPDMLFTVETVSCLGACGLAPVMIVNESVHGQLTPEKAVAVIAEIQEKAASKEVRS